MRVVYALRVVLILVLVGVGVTPSSASARKPTREPVILEDVPRLEGVCPFPVSIVFPVNREFVRTFTDREGNVVREITTGTVQAIVTNLSTGKSVRLNISGPVFTRPHPDGAVTLTLRGRALVGLFPGEVPSQPVRLFVNAGQVVLSLDPAGNIVQFRQVGHLEDVCAALAS